MLQRPPKKGGNIIKLQGVCVAVFCVVWGLMANPAWAQPSVLLPGYTLTTISSNVPSSGIAQLAFNPIDDTHLYATRVGSNLVTRYDYNPITAELSNALNVADLLGTSPTSPSGLAFHNNDLYVSLSNGPGDGRMTRLSNPDVNGIYQTRHDFVHSIPTGSHDVNQIQIVGDTLYVGIGAAGRTGDPAQENLYTMTIARIGDLTQIDFSGPIDSDFKGPINYLADELDWIIPFGSDGLLRYYASGFRNPFGIATDVDGDLWLSSNGNSDPGFLSPDFLYKKVPQGGQGIFPPASFGFGMPHITGIPIQPFVDLGQSPSPTGFDFVPSGPDAGKVILAQFGAGIDPNVGRDVLLIDPDTGDIETLITGFAGPTDVVQDPFGCLLVADIGDSSVWRLCHGSGSTPAIFSPPLSSPLMTSPVNFQWSAGSGVAEYWLGVGTSQAAVANAPWGNIFAQSTGTNLSANVSGIPLTGNPVFVRVWWRIGTTWSFTDYTYQTQ